MVTFDKVILEYSVVSFLVPQVFHETMIVGSSSLKACTCQTKGTIYLFLTSHIQRKLERVKNTFLSAQTCVEWGLNTSLGINWQFVMQYTFCENILLFRCLSLFFFFFFTVGRRDCATGYFVTRLVPQVISQISQISQVISQTKKEKHVFLPTSNPTDIIYC